MLRIEESFGARLTHAKLDEVGIPDTPDYLSYAYKDQNEVSFPWMKKSHLK